MHHKVSLPGAFAKAESHRRRCSNLPPLQTGEAEKLIAGFLATRGVTPCPTRYAVAIEQQPLLSRRPL
jgi:hypothetical protein